MAENNQKMREVIQKLWLNPQIKDYPLSKKENQILLFLKENSSQLQGALTKPDYFPDLNWNSILTLMLNELAQTVIFEAEKIVNEILMKILDSGAFNQFKENQREIINVDSFKSFIAKSMQNKQIRDQYLNSILTIHWGYINRYFPIIMANKKFIYIDTIRKEKLTSVDSFMLTQGMNLAILFRPLFYYKFTKSDTKQTLSLDGLYRDKRAYESASSELAKSVFNEFGWVQNFLFRSGLDSNLNANEVEMNGVSKLISIFMHRASEYDPNLKLDRGAESPDKSWFSITRRMAKHYGYDSKYLDELYQISSDEGW